MDGLLNLDLTSAEIVKGLSGTQKSAILMMLLGEEEAAEIIRLALDNLDAYLWEVKDFNHTADEAACAVAQNYYCENQQQNPHTPRTMKSLGLPEAEVDKFCKDMLFPKIA